MRFDFVFCKNRKLLTSWKIHIARLKIIERHKIRRRIKYKILWFLLLLVNKSKSYTMTSSLLTSFFFSTFSNHLGPSMQCERNSIMQSITIGEAADKFPEDVVRIWNRSSFIVAISIGWLLPLFYDFDALNSKAFINVLSGCDFLFLPYSIICHYTLLIENHI